MNGMTKSVATAFLGAFTALQGLTAVAQSNEKPKLIVGIVVDQMRWDYLYRYYDRYEAGGFKRMLGDGFSCENTFISHLPSFTAVGHSTIYTGSVPAIHGITGNDWPDQLTGRKWYCTEDTTVQPVGSSSSAGKMSPRNLLASTITDELKLATNFRSKVVGVSLKDRASILPAGHTPNGAFWLDDSNGSFITSTWYMKELPEWVKRFNDRKEPQQLMSKPWETLYPINTYVQSSEDNVDWEGTFPGEKAPVFPHALKDAYKKDPGNLRSTPGGNTLTLDFAKAAIEGYDLGNNTVTDFLTINCASTDYVGHKYGPNSIEVEDTYLRLDKDLSAFFTYLDQRVGKGNYLVFLTADHGAAHAIKFMEEHKLPAGITESRKLVAGLDSTLNVRFGVSKLVSSFMNYHVSFDKAKIAASKLDYDAVKKETVKYFEAQPGIQFAADLDNIGVNPLPEPLNTMAINGYNRKRTGSVIVIPEPGWFEGSLKGTTHGNWNPFDIHIPLVFMGWHVKHGASNETVHMTDIAATLAAMLHIQMPSGCVGKPVKEILQ
ncbi:Predicted pyrophosphatase or phosphodiesterase, AlkP superfamily [Chitinophaga ginsengisegetis]|uniref:Predicted pyrophosphatase or phosphodiesterase, AlkP superfamily n=1 Tax=Chitinophaga ginsengisegetis TaxID=393003 RepID=A0A1T5P8C7_9BACT|nr:alkaline phosphatase PafA [Chitinophaga ginsengisegetis]SKD08971.1 Predicted pyrophosphatase or phosphodiesterase, AlkP superfamily [Chitinophaga ginsengisegetis]